MVYEIMVEEPIVEIAIEDDSGHPEFLVATEPIENEFWPVVDEEIEPPPKPKKSTKVDYVVKGAGPQVTVLLPVKHDLTWEVASVLKAYTDALNRAGVYVEAVAPEDDFADALSSIREADKILVVSIGYHSAPVRSAVLGRLHDVTFLHLLAAGPMWPYATVKESGVLTGSKANVFPSNLAMVVAGQRTGRRLKAYRNFHVIRPYIDDGSLSVKDAKKLSEFARGFSKVWVGDVFDGSEKSACSDEGAALYVIPTVYENIECFGDDGERVFASPLFLRDGAVSALLQDAELLYSAPIAGYAPFGVPVALAIQQRSKYHVTGNVGAVELQGHSKKQLLKGLAEFVDLVM